MLTETHGKEPPLIYDLINSYLMKQWSNQQSNKPVKLWIDVHGGALVLQLYAKLPTAVVLPVSVEVVQRGDVESCIVFI